MKHCLFIIAISVQFAALGQDKLIKSVPYNGTVLFAGVDRPGDLYVVMNDGLIRKYDNNGKEITSKKYNTAPTLFETGDGTRSFVYFRDHQQIEFLSPSMNVLDARTLNPEFAVSPWLVCPSRNELWVVDSADLSLKQTNERATSVGFDVVWAGAKPKAVSDIAYMREYLNFLFVHDKGSGLHVFNHLGRQIRHINEPSLAWFNFLGEELYYMKGSALMFVDLYTGEQREAAVPADCIFVSLTDERMILVRPGQIEFWTYKPD